MQAQFKAQESARKGCRWLLTQLQKDGSLTGGDDLRAYYKTVAAFAIAGNNAQAELVLDHIQSRFSKGNGDLEGEGVLWFGTYRTYLHSWICVGAMMRGRFELAHPLARFIATFHDPLSGGFFADEARTVQEVMTTSMAGLACLWAGDKERALAAGRWLQNLYDAQPDLTRGLYTSWKDNALVISDEPGCLVDAAKPKQWYFQYGISAALLSSLAASTGDNHWLRLAEKFLDASRLCFADRSRTPQSGKVGWGAAWTYRLSQRKQDAQLCAEVVDGLCGLQNGDGSWLATGVYGGETAEADSVTIDVTSEFVALQGAIGLIANV